MDKTLSDIVCPVCSSKDIFLYLEKTAVRAVSDIFRCKSCKLVFFGRTGKLDDSYWHDHGQENLYLNPRIKVEFKAEFDRLIKEINSFFPSRGRLLDIGCGLGDFLTVARSNGWDVSGVEVSEKAAQFCRSKLSLKVQTGTVEQADLADKYFDVITMWDVIEHVQDPVLAVEAIGRKLKPGGILAIKTPDEESLFKSSSRVLYNLSFGRVKGLVKYVYYVPHYFYYNSSSLKYLLNKFNLKPVVLRREQTSYQFAKSKIKYHYRKFFGQRLILVLLPVIYSVSRFFRYENKMLIFARKDS